MVNYPDINNGQGCESDNKTQLVNNGFSQRCDSGNNKQSRTSNDTDKIKCHRNYTSVKNRFWPLSTQAVKYSGQ